MSRRPGSRPQVGLVGRAALSALVLALALSGCGVLPTSGAVRHVERIGASGPEGSARFVPPGPSPGDSQEEVVSGFLVAMTGNPLGVPIARRFLTGASQDSWRPSRRIVVYDSARVSAGDRPDQATVSLRGVRRLDERGGWLGGSDDATAELRVDLRLEDDQWRVSAPPDALIVPSWWFTEHYRPLSLYFFEQTDRVLVPNRVYVPRGDDAATALVRGLLGGPGSALAPVTRTAIPSGTGLDLSVLVRRNGVADVPLSGPVGDLPAERLGRLIAQLTTTLRQVPGIRRIRLLTGDTALTLPNGRRSVSIDFGARFSPSVNGSSDAVYALRDGLVVAGRGGGSAVDGPFGTMGLVLRSIAVSVAGDRVAGVGRDGRSVLTAEVSGDAAAARRLYTGQDVLPPAYDVFGETWLVDRRREGARVVLADGRGVRAVRLPGITGRRVTSFLVSRDGTRFVALVDGGASPDRLVLTYLRRSPDGSLRGTSAERTLPGVPAELGDLVDLAWFGPSDLAVLGRPSEGISEVTFVTVDGSPGDPDTIPPDTWRGDARGLVGSYDPALPLYLRVPASGGDDRLLVLDRSTSRWRPSDIDDGLDAATYAG